MSLLKIAVVGAGGIGAYIGAKLALAGEDVSFFARGANLEALRRRGVELVLPDGSSRIARVPASNAYAEAGTFDVLILAVKAHQLASVAGYAAHLVREDTVVVPMQNGIPYWYFHRYGGELEGRRLESVDPGGYIATQIPPHHVLGCVVYPAAELVAPGVVRLVEGERFPLGEPDGSQSPRATRVADAFIRAGLKSPVLTDIRAEIWLKLWGNLTFNPISALTRATLAAICADASTRALAVHMMREAQAVAASLGVSFRVPLERRIEGAAKVGHHKTSMLQDVEAGRTIELDALLGSVIELGRLTGVATAHLDSVYALTRLLARTAQDVSAVAESGAALKNPGARAAV